MREERWTRDGVRREVRDRVQDDGGYVRRIERARESQKERESNGGDKESFGGWAGRRGRAWR